MTNYKGFDENLKCRDFQYEIGKEYVNQGGAKACSHGFHACKFPMDMFSYYGPAKSRYAEVDQSGEISEEGSDTKVASSKIKVVAEINIAGIVKASIKYIRESVTTENKASTSGYKAHSATRSDYAHSATSGKKCISASLGNYGKAKAGEDGCLVLRWTDSNNRPRVSVAYTGENGIKAGVWYALDDAGQFVEISDEN